MHDPDQRKKKIYFCFFDFLSDSKTEEIQYSRYAREKFQIDKFPELVVMLGPLHKFITQSAGKPIASEVQRHFEKLLIFISEEVRLKHMEKLAKTHMFLRLSNTYVRFLLEKDGKQFNTNDQQKLRKRLDNAVTVFCCDELPLAKTIIKLRKICLDYRKYLEKSHGSEAKKVLLVELEKLLVVPTPTKINLNPHSKHAFLNVLNSFHRHFTVSKREILLSSGDSAEAKFVAMISTLIESFLHATRIKHSSNSFSIFSTGRRCCNGIDRLLEANGIKLRG